MLREKRTGHQQHSRTTNSPAHHRPIHVPGTLRYPQVVYARGYSIQLPPGHTIDSALASGANLPLTPLNSIKVSCYVEEALAKHFMAIDAQFSKLVSDIKEAIRQGISIAELQTFFVQVQHVKVEPASATVDTLLTKMDDDCTLFEHKILSAIISNFSLDIYVQQFEQFEKKYAHFLNSVPLMQLMNDDMIKYNDHDDAELDIKLVNDIEGWTRVHTKKFKKFVIALNKDRHLKNIQKVLKAMSEESGNIKVSLITLHGPPGAGKTSLKRLLLGKPPLPPKQQNSTPVVEQPARAIATGKIGLKQGSKQLEEINEKKFIELLAQHVHQLTPDQISENIVTTASTSSMPPSTGHTIVPPDHDKPIVLPNPLNSTPSSIMSNPSALPSSSVQATGSLKNIAKNLMHVKRFTCRNVFDMQWFHIIDSGGQPQFQDVLPLLFHTQSLHIVVIRLSERLDDKPKFHYIREGKKLECLPKNLTLTNFQIIERTCQLAQASSNGHEPPWVMVVGTHLDCIKECDETLEEKNSRLNSQLFEKYRNVLIRRNKNEIIFSVNAMIEVGLQRQKHTDELQKIVLDAPTINDAFPVFVKWLVLEIELSRISSKNKGVISINDCYKVADSLGMAKKETDDALKYFTDVIIHLYYPDVLPQLLFTQMNPVVDRLSALISTSFTYSKPGPIGRQYKLQHEGIFNKAYLKQYCGETTTVHFTDDDFLKLLEHLYIAVHVSEDEYFLPCALSISDDQGCQPSRLCDPLVFTWENKIVPHGFFPTLIANLLQQESVFTLPRLEKEQKRHRVYLKCRNLKFPGAICVVDATLWLELHYYGNQKYCPEIRTMVEKSISEVSRILRLLYMVTPQLGFICNGLICDMSIDRHICTLTDGTCEVTCSIGIDTTTVTNNRQLCWLQESKFIRLIYTYCIMHCVHYF